MAFLDSLKEVITQRPANLKKPHFYKIDSDAKAQLEQLKEILPTVPSDMQARVEQDIKMLSYGVVGEDNVAFELNNSYLPIIVLHDLHIEHDGLSAQIDYLIITTKFALIVECKNLIGNIEVNSNGDFIRTTEYRGKFKKEGIYSPITQNTRHLEMIKKIRLSSKNNIFTRSQFEKDFNDNYKSVVVLANPKTIINLKYAKKEVKDQIIRCDQLIEHIKKLLKESKNDNTLEKYMYERADFFLSYHTPNTVDYTKKYFTEENTKEEVIKPESLTAKSVQEEIVVESITKENKQQDAIVNIEDTPIYQALKQYRYETSKAEEVKAYFVFNNAQMEALIAAMPKSLEEIKNISGFGEAKCQKYGNAILEIVSKYI